MAPAPFRFALAYGDHMVLQRAPARATIWGFAPAAATVEVTGVGTAAVTAVAGSDGVWKVALPATDAAVPHTITARIGGGSTITLSDVLFGDVWVCGGQSNSEPAPRFTALHS